MKISFLGPEGEMVVAGVGIKGPKGPPVRQNTIILVSI